MKLEESVAGETKEKKRVFKREDGEKRGRVAGGSDCFVKNRKGYGAPEKGGTQLAKRGQDEDPPSNCRCTSKIRRGKVCQG